jgi:hypothetical protein
MQYALLLIRAADTTSMPQKGQRLCKAIGSLVEALRKAQIQCAAAIQEGKVVS